MSTTKQRINISIPDDILKALGKLAERDRVPKATKAARLIELALEIEEDTAWNLIAEKRDRNGAKFFSHKKAWK